MSELLPRPCMTWPVLSSPTSSLWPSPLLCPGFHTCLWVEHLPPAPFTWPIHSAGLGWEVTSKKACLTLLLLCCVWFQGSLLLTCLPVYDHGRNGNRLGQGECTHISVLGHLCNIPITVCKLGQEPRKNQGWLQPQFRPEIAVDGSNEEAVLEMPLRMLNDPQVA